MTEMMNWMKHLIQIDGEVTHLPTIQNRIMGIVAIEVAVERDQPTLVEAHQVTPDDGGNGSDDNSHHSCQSNNQNRCPHHNCH